MLSLDPLVGRNPQSAFSLPGVLALLSFVNFSLCLKLPSRVWYQTYHKAPIMPILMFPESIYPVKLMNYRVICSAAVYDCTKKLEGHDRKSHAITFG
jgi:hypothetical protein